MLQSLCSYTNCTLPSISLCARGDLLLLISQSQVKQPPVQPQENGTSPGACVEQQPQHLLQKLLDSESKYRLASEELQVLRTQQSKEMEQVKARISQEFYFCLFSSCLALAGSHSLHQLKACSCLYRLAS